MSAPEQVAKPRTRARKQEVPTKAPPAVSREAYAAFIGQIELAEIWLQGADLKNEHGPQTPDQATFHFSSDARWEPRGGGFRIFHHYKVRVEAVDDLLAELDATFGLDFTSAESMTDDVFAIFEDVNLPVNTWPFLREFVSTTIGRMGWVPFTIPAFKQGVRRARRPTKAARSRASQGHKVEQTGE